MNMMISYQELVRTFPNIRCMYFVYIIKLILVFSVVCNIGEVSILVRDYKYK